MLVSQVRDRVRRIRELAYEKQLGAAAHEAEHLLMKDVLRAIMEGRGDDPTDLAKATFEATKINFPREYV